MLILRWLTNKVFLIQRVKFYLQSHGRLPHTLHLRSQMLLCYLTMVVQVILSARLGAAVWSGISDCDETFNYWEPAHFMLYGNGLQTWEYQVPLSLDEDLSSSPINFQPTYALRSYLYILAHAVPGWIYSRLLQPNPMLVFYFLRCMFGFISALCEVLQSPPPLFREIPHSFQVYFYRGVLCEFGANVGRLCLAILVFSTGMFISSTAFLPSTTSMYLCLLSMGAWFHHKYHLAIFTTALSTFLSECSKSNVSRPK